MIMNEPLPNSRHPQYNKQGHWCLTAPMLNAQSLALFMIPLYSFGVALKNAAGASGASFDLQVYLA